MSAVQLFSGASFISSEFTDIYFEVKAELSFYFYAFGDVFRRNGIVQQDCIVNNHFELERTVPKNKNTLQIKSFFIFAPVVSFFQNGCGKVFR